jgi:DNA-binding transcriptional MerR regulator
VATETLMKTGEVGRELDVSVSYVHRLTELGLLPIAATTRDNWKLFRPSDVAALRARRQARRNPTAAGAGQPDAA